MFCYMVGRNHATTLYIKRLTKVNVSATVGMPGTVGEMSATVGKLNML